MQHQLHYIIYDKAQHGQNTHPGWNLWMCLWLQTWWYFCWGFGESWANMFHYIWIAWDVQKHSATAILIYVLIIITVVLNSSLWWWSVHSRNMNVWKLGDPAVTLRPWQNHRTYIAIECWKQLRITQEMSSVGVHRESMGEKTTFNALDNARVQLCFGQGLSRFWSYCWWMRSRTTWDVYAAFCPTLESLMFSFNAVVMTNDAHIFREGKDHLIRCIWRFSEPYLYRKH